MHVHRTRFFGSGATAAVLSGVIALAGNLAIAEEGAAQSADTDEVIDEMVITAGEKSGDPVDLDALYAEEMRERIMRDQEVLRKLEEEDRWRRSVSGPAPESSSRIQWGYSSQDELKMQREADMAGYEQRETVKPATVFRVGF